MDEKPSVKKRSSIIVYLIAFPIAWLIGGALALLVLNLVDRSFQFGPGTEVLIWIGTWIVFTLALTVGIGVRVQSDSSKPKTRTGRAAQPQDDLETGESGMSTPQASKRWSAVAVMAWLLVGAAVVYGCVAISFWSNQ